MLYKEKIIGKLWAVKQVSSQGDITLFEGTEDECDTFIKQI